MIVYAHIESLIYGEHLTVYSYNNAYTKSINYTVFSDVRTSMCLMIWP